VSEKFRIFNATESDAHNCYGAVNDLFGLVLSTSTTRQCRRNRRFEKVSDF